MNQGIQKNMNEEVWGSVCIDPRSLDLGGEWSASCLGPLYEAGWVPEPVCTM
jgi:hypothetical protein